MGYKSKNKTYIISSLYKHHLDLSVYLFSRHTCKGNKNEKLIYFESIKYND